jgi:hypothetical protein
MKLPFSALNQQPGVSGLQDVDLPIGDVLDIVQDIQDTVFSTDDLLELLEGDAQGALEDATPIDEIASVLSGDSESDISIDLQGIVDQLTEVIDEAEVSIIEQIIEARLEIIDTVQEETNELSVVLDGIEVDEDELADEIADQLDLPGDGGTVISFDSVFGAIASDIVESFNIALDSTIGTPDQLPDGIGTVFGGIAEILENLGDGLDFGGEELITSIQVAVVDGITELPGGGLLQSPNSFIDGQIDRVTDGLVDQSAVNNLEESIGEVV